MSSYDDWNNSAATNLENVTFVVIGKATRHFTNLSEASEFAETVAPANVYKRIARTVPTAHTIWDEN